MKLDVYMQWIFYITRLIAVFSLVAYIYFILKVLCQEQYHRVSLQNDQPNDASVLIENTESYCNTNIIFVDRIIRQI